MTNILTTLRHTAQRFFRVQQYIFIQLTDTVLYIAHVKKHKSSYLPIQSTVHQLTNLEVANHHLYNLTALRTHVQQFIDAAKIVQPHLIISTTLANEQTPCVLFQIALCFGKGKLRIEKIISGTIPSMFFQTPASTTTLPIAATTHNLLDNFLSPTYHTAHRWLAISMLLFGFVCAGFTFYYDAEQRSVRELDKQLHQYQCDVCSLQQKTNTLQTAEKKNEQLRKKISALTTLIEYTNNPYNTCAAIAKQMPKQSYLTFLEIGSSEISDKKESQQTSIPLTLRGSTHNPSEINDFVKHLNESFKDAQFSLARIRKAQKPKRVAKAKTQTPVAYSFTINGIISS